jgi:hypothetical protein
MVKRSPCAIVATQRGGLIEFPSGPYRRNGKPAIRPLSWAQVDMIADQFAALSPYDRSVIPGSILKIEDDNFDPETGRQRQLWCLAISAKRYALFLRDPIGEPALLREGINNKEDRYSEHGLGHLLNPTDPESDDRSWIAQAWRNIVRRSLGLPTKPLGFEKRVAVGRITISSPNVVKPFAALNAGKSYAQQIKPFNFILSCSLPSSGIRSVSTPSASTSSRRTKLIRGNGRSGNGSISILASGIGSRLQVRTARAPSRASKATATCCGSTSFIPKPSAPTPAALRARSKPSGFSAGATSRSIRSHTSARSRIASKRSKSKVSSMPPTFTPSIPIRGATSGRPRFCQDSRPCLCASSWRGPDCRDRRFRR